MLFNFTKENLYQLVSIILSIFDQKIQNDVKTVFLTRSNCEYYKRYSTQYCTDTNTLYFYNAPDMTGYENLMALAHECWHIVQKNRNYNLKYSNEDALKYCKEHMFMLCDYNFESEANGYAQVFVLYYLKTIYYINHIDNILNDIDTFSKPVYCDETDFDSFDDYIIISEKLKDYYNIALDKFDKLFFNEFSEIYKIYLSNVSTNDPYKLEKAKWIMNSNIKNIKEMIKIYNIIEKKYVKVFKK